MHWNDSTCTLLSFFWVKKLRTKKGKRHLKPFMYLYQHCIFLDEQKFIEMVSLAFCKEFSSTKPGEFEMRRSRKMPWFIYFFTDLLSQNLYPPPRRVEDGHREERNARGFWVVSNAYAQMGGLPDSQWSKIRSKISLFWFFLRTCKDLQPLNPIRMEITKRGKKFPIGAREISYVKIVEQKHLKISENSMCWLKCVVSSP